MRYAMMHVCTVCPESSDPFYITYYIEWVTTSWTHSIFYTNTTRKNISGHDKVLGLFYVQEQTTIESLLLTNCAKNLGHDCTVEKVVNLFI